MSVSWNAALTDLVMQHSSELKVLEITEEKDAETNSVRARGMNEARDNRPAHRRSVTSDMKRLRKTFTYLLTSYIYLHFIFYYSYYAVCGLHSDRPCLINE